ncbi:hypothetical protein BDP27DRAFT_1441137 [Rhodocollybia butyracea]|uniref:Uncharacterized protein n=1 Tax=Rhodocollybia butyracea TaxID=206335 RepID=A0A9P5QAZ6_9AGAR|nr:hypothetical protein BDP27DRAFT_1441137 [Rhodocollybia butyracea]
MTIMPGYPYVRGSIPHYLPLQWTAYTHPEGQLYFHRNSELQITTEAYLYSPEILVKVLYWAKTIEAMLEEKNIPISNALELYLMIEDTGCAYYFVDHASQSQFWLEQVQSDELGIPDVDSPSHLNIYLQHLYWCHIEHFPMHLGGLSIKCVDELLSVFTHALTDQITSQTSTFFYTQAECTQFIKVIKLARQSTADGHNVCVIARLWSQVCDNRFQTHYGQEASRLSRDQAILYDSPQPSRISTVARYLTFNSSEVYLAKLNDLFVDRLLYFSQWQPFIRRSIQGWRRSFYTAIAIIMLHGFFFLFQCSPMLAVASASLSFASLFTSAILVHRYERLESDDACANDVHEHLIAIHSEKYDFQFVALSWALPSALQLWALGLVALNAVVALCQIFGVRWAAYCGLSVIILLVWLLRTTDQTSWNVSSWLRREKAEQAMV